MARDVVVDLVTRHDSRGLRSFADGMDKAATKVDGLDTQMDDLASTSSHLQVEIARTKQAIVELGEEFDRTGDRTLFGDMRKQQGHLRELERMAKAAAGASVEVGQRAGIIFADGFSRAGATRIGPAAVALIGGAVIAAAPGLGAMLAGALAGSLGTVGLAGGILTAAKDPRVRSAAREFGTDISREFFRGEAFVDPAIEAMAELKDAFRDMEVPESLAKLAPVTDDIAKGFGDLGRNFMPGFNKALDRMGPFAEEAEEGLGGLGTALGVLADRATRSEGAVTGLDLLFRTINGSIALLGAGLEVASDITDKFAEAMANASGSVSGLLRGLGLDALADAASKWSTIWLDIGGDLPDKRMFKVGEAVDASTGSVRNAIPSWEAYNEKIRETNEAVERSISLALAQDNATHGLQSAMLDLKESIKENGRHWETNTAKGLANRRALLDAVAAAERKRQADIDSGISADVANRAYQRTIDKLKGVATRAGIARDDLDDLVGDYNITVHIRTKGSFPKLRYKNNYLEGEPFPTKGFATGGTTPAFEPFRVHDGETLWSSKQHFVATKSQTDGLARGGMGGGGQARPVVVQLMIGPRVVREVLIDEALMRGIPQATVAAAFP